MADTGKMFPGYRLILCLVVFLQTTRLFLAAGVDSFNEELFIRPFSSGHELFFFQFTTIWKTKNPYTHYRLFPKSLGDVLSAYEVQELHLTQTQGLWRYDKWGYPPEDAPPGAELWVWFKPGTKEIDQKWSDLVNALGGLFCSSLNFMDAKSTVMPRWSFRPNGAGQDNYGMKSIYLRYSALPREIVCTENLTPWRKLLPCDKVGLSTLFNTAKLYDSDYHSIAVHVRPICSDKNCLSTSIELKQTLSVVFDTSFSGRQDWSFKSTLGQSLLDQCPLATTSQVYVDITSQQATGMKLKPDPDETVQIVRGGDPRMYAVYKLASQLSKNNNFLNIQGTYTQDVKYGQEKEPSVYAQRYITGYGLQRGGITTQISNTLSQNVTVIYMETIPWFIKVYFNSLKIQNNQTDIKPYKIHYTPGKDRARSYHLELVFRLKANSVTKITLSFERAFLKWTEYPPDANHGFYINSAVLTTVLPTGHGYTSVPQNGSLFSDSLEGNSSQFFLRIHTETLLVSLPTPDFSMPYNVICLACTVVAIAFGSLHNLTTRQFKAVDPKQAKGIVEKIKNFIKGNKKTKESSVTEHSDNKNKESTDNVKDKVETDS